MTEPLRYPGVQIYDSSGNMVTSFGGGGGAATIADGADVAEGATTATESTSGNGTVVGILKNLRTRITTLATLLNGGLPAALGTGGGLKVDGSGTALPVTAAQATGTNLHAVIDTGSTTAVTQATGTNLHAVIDTGSTTAVTQATASNLNAQVVGAVASGATASGNPVLHGGRAATTVPTAVTDGQAVAAMLTKHGRTVVTGWPRDLRGSQRTVITSSTAETTIATQVASTFLDLYKLVLTNSSATGTQVDIRDTTAGTIIESFFVPALDTRGFTLPAGDGLAQTTVNTNWTATCISSVASLTVSAFFTKST